MAWSIWGDVTDPIKVGLTEREARTFLDENSHREIADSWYAENENGDQIEYHNGPIIRNNKI